MQQILVELRLKLGKIVWRTKAPIPWVPALTAVPHSIPTLVFLIDLFFWLFSFFHIVAGLDYVANATK